MFRAQLQVNQGRVTAMVSMGNDDIHEITMCFLGIGLLYGYTCKEHMERGFRPTRLPHSDRHRYQSGIRAWEATKQMMK